jgi:predicted metal-binding membrane protein
MLLLIVAGAAGLAWLLAVAIGVLVSRAARRSAVLAGRS